MATNGREANLVGVLLCATRTGVGPIGCYDYRSYSLAMDSGSVSAPDGRGHFPILMGQYFGYDEDGESTEVPRSELKSVGDQMAREWDSRWV